MVVKNPLRKHYGKFTQITKKLVEHPIIGWDTEDNSKGTVTLFAFYGDDGPFVTRFFREAIDYIYTIETPTTFVAHNLEYDVINLFKHEDYERIEDMVYSGTRLLKMTLKGCPHTFVDSGAFFRGSLKALGEFVGLPKLEGNSLSEEYIIRDAQIPYVFLKQFQKNLIEKEGINLGITIGQMAMEIYRRNYMLDKTQFTYNSPNCFKAYYGGRVEAFYLGLLDNKVHVSDINSSYPDVMRNNFFPDTGTIVPSSIKTHKYGIGKFKMYVPEDTFLPVLPYKEKKSGRLFFPVGTFTGWWCYQEVRYAVENGAVILEEYEGEGTNFGCAPFVNFVENYFMKKSSAKELGDKFSELLFKLVLNNLYGKFFQWRGGNRMTRDPIPMYKLEKYMKHPEFDTKKVGPFYWYHLPKVEPPKTANFMWGLYITAYARINLHKGLKSTHDVGYTPVYCDTDSIMYSDIHKKGLTRIPVTVSKKLGDWDHEVHDMGVFRQAKAYILYDKEGDKYIPKKVACKGVPTEYAHEFVIEGMAKFQKPYRLKESLVRTTALVNQEKGEDFIHELGANIWSDVTKEMKSIYIKRRGDEGITYPQNVDDLPDVVKKAAQEERLDFLREVAEYDLERTEKRPAFIQPEIPADYFEGEPSRDYEPTVSIPKNPYRLTFGTLEGMRKGEVWFKGIPLRWVKRVKGEVVEVKRLPKNPKPKIWTQIIVTEFKGVKSPRNFYAEINAKILEDFFEPENFGKKNLEIILMKNYIKDEYPELGYNF